jgi:hypothetical protein
VLGTLNSVHTLDIEGGSIGGSGTIAAPLTLSGTGVFDPGDPQTTTVSGAFTMTGGSIDLTILGPNPVDQDHIVFGGSADFSGGTINLNIPLGVNLNGDSLDLFTFDAGLSGTLPTFNFVNGQNYQVAEVTDQSGTHFEFSGNTVTGTGAPEPASLILFGSALGLLLAGARCARKRSLAG